jgi:mRNA interferase RelE/StbE
MAKIYLTPNTQNLYKKIRDSKLKSKIKVGLAKLSQDPYLGKKLKGELEGQYSIKIWPYRILYYITPTKDIVVTDIRHRKDVYR